MRRFKGSQNSVKADRPYTSITSNSTVCLPHRHPTQGHHFGQNFPFLGNHHHLATQFHHTPRPKPEGLRALILSIFSTMNSLMHLDRFFQHFFFDAKQQFSLIGKPILSKYFRDPNMFRSFSLLCASKGNFS